MRGPFNFLLIAGLGLSLGSCKPGGRMGPDAAQELKSEDPTDRQSRLTVEDCAAAEVIGKVTASPSGSLLITDPAVVGSDRARGGGKWSFAYLMREILELPEPGNDPNLLAREDAYVKQFLSRFTQEEKINGFSPANRMQTTYAIENLWPKVSGPDQKAYRTFDRAPFTLRAIVNRIDVVKPSKSDGTAGEGRFLFGFDGTTSPFFGMTVIFEYDLPIGRASGKGVRDISDWAQRWQSLKDFLVDTNEGNPGVQPDQTIGATLNFRDKEGYLQALEDVTELFASRSAQQRENGKTQAAIAQIRSNETLTPTWNLRESIRDRDDEDRARLSLVTVTNTPDFSSFRNGEKGFNEWIEAHVVCSGSERESCRYDTPDAQLPLTIPSDSGEIPLLTGSIDSSNRPDIRWFASGFAPDPNVKKRFVALNTCNGCHTLETNASFVHVDPKTGQPSFFLKKDLALRLVSFKNLICLAATSQNSLNLTGSSRIDKGKREYVNDRFTH